MDCVQNETRPQNRIQCTDHGALKEKKRKEKKRISAKSLAIQHPSPDPESNGDFLLATDVTVCYK
jgi:hypothetical protein